MHLSMWSSFLLELAPEEMVRTLAEHGWRCAELSDEHARMLLDRGDAGAIGSAFRAHAADCGLSFPQGHLWLGADIAHPDPKIRSIHVAILKRWCDLFVAAGVNAAVVHPGGSFRTDSMSAADVAVLSRESLAELIIHIAGSDMALCLENVFGLVSFAPGLLDLLAPFPPAHTGICLDTGHLNIDGGSFRDFVVQAGQALKALHIHDNSGKRDDHMLPYGGGTVPWPEVLGALRDAQYARAFTFEIPGEARCPWEAKMAKLDYARILGERMTEGRA